MPGYDAELRDDDGNTVDAPDTPGYLHVRGESAALGYWERPDATAAAFFEDRWVRTGDVYTRGDGGHWTFLGRNNDMIKAGGIWVSPAEVEAALIEHETVLEAAVVGARDDHGLEMVVAFVVPASGATPDPAVLEQHCRDRLATFKRPRRVIVVADTVEAMTSDRPYRKALPLDAVVRELHKFSGTQFDPSVVQAFLKLLDQEGESFISKDQKFDFYAFIEG